MSKKNAARKNAKRKIQKQRRSRGGSHQTENEPGSGAAAAAAYLEHWANRAAEPGWKFRKNRQSYLLRVKFAADAEALLHKINGMIPKAGKA